MRVNQRARIVAAVAGLVIVSGCNLLDLLGELDELNKSERVEKLVTAAEGGQVTIKDVRIDIPAGALAVDTTVTAETLDADEMPGAVASTVIDFGPDGLQFQTPVTLTFDYSGSGPEGATPKLAFLEAGQWTVLSDSRVENGKVVATTTHFTPFAVIWEGGQQAGGGCEEMPFTACGGNIEGAWEFELGCVKLPPNHVPIADCPEATARYDVEVSGTFTTAEPNNYTVRRTRTLVKEFRAPKSCLPQGKTCEEIPDFDDEFESASSDGDFCVATGKRDVNDDGEGGTYAIEGTSLRLTKAGSGSSTVLGYCVTGDSAVVATVDSDGVEQRFRMTRK